MRQNVDEKKAGRDVKKVEKRADAAKADAEVAVDFAHAAIEEAECAVLKAILVRMDANDLAANSGGNI